MLVNKDNVILEIKKEEIEAYKSKGFVELKQDADKTEKGNKNNKDADKTEK